MTNFESIFNIYECSLKEYNCTFLYQRKNCKKHGHFKKKINRKTNVITYEIRIDKDDNDAAKIYTFMHEWAHMYNKHLDVKELTYSQKEFVAHEIAMYTIKKFELEKSLECSNLQKKWDINSYGVMWMKGKQISERKLIIMNKQIQRSVSYCELLYK